MFVELKHVAALNQLLGGAQVLMLLRAACRTKACIVELKHVAALTKPLGGAQARTLFRAALLPEYRHSYKA